MLVELFGQPGAGKTSLVRAAAAGSELRGRASLGAAWKQQSNIGKAAYFARAILDPACLVHAIKLAIGARLFHRDSLSRLARLVIKSHWVRSQTGLLLMEEGHLQDLWSIFYSAGELEPEPRLLAPLIGCLYRDVDVQLVFLEVDPQSAFDRIRARAHGKSRFDQLAEEELRKQLAASAQLPYKLAEAARLAGLKVERLDASLPVEESVHLLSALLRRS
ncbi:MAG: hypothetical protein M3Q19_12745 [Pseudomonadota bacterium]|nr:hypothetical protein [Pseudomonadota bacterium]